MLRRLIKYGAKVDVRDRISREPLMWAASSGNLDVRLLQLSKNEIKLF